MTRAILFMFTVVFSLIGILYILDGEILWGSVVLVVASIYLFGFEPAYGESAWHPLSHIITGGIFAFFLSAFLALEKLMSLLSKPEGFSRPDLMLIVTSLVAVIISARFSRGFER